MHVCAFVCASVCELGGSMRVRVSTYKLCVSLEKGSFVIEKRPNEHPRFKPRKEYKKQHQIGRVRAISVREREKV